MLMICWWYGPHISDCTSSSSSISWPPLTDEMEQCCEARPFFLAPPSTHSRYQACGGYCNRVLLCGAAIFCCLLLLLFCFPCCLLGSHHCIHLLDGFRPLLLHMLNMHRPRLGGCTLSHTLAQIALPKSSSDPITVLSHTTTNWILKKFLDTHTLKSPRVGCIGLPFKPPSKYE